MSRSRRLQRIHLIDLTARASADPYERSGAVDQIFHAASLRTQHLRLVRLVEAGLRIRELGI